MASETRLGYLMECYFARTGTEEERQELLQLIDSGEYDEAIRAWMDASASRLSEEYRLTSEASDKIFAAILDVEAEPAPNPVVPLYTTAQKPNWWIGRAVAAAVILLLAGSATWYLTSRQTKITNIGTIDPHYKGDVAPGHNGAILTLASGQRITLDSAADGKIARQGDVEIIKQDGAIVYSGHSDVMVYNDVSTARGRQWQLTLPDGTKVWLNSASSIHYPVNFTGGVREVEVKGEAYFEVAHDARRPFHVRVGDQLIEDIGTSFNVNAYADEPVGKITLIEGAVRVSTADFRVLLRPGQEVSETGGQLKVSGADTARAIAWMHGIFSCNHTSIAELMRQLARWYNVEVEYKGTIPADMTFTGDMGRNLSLVQVLHGLRGMNLRFSIEEDKKIVIMP